MFLLSCSCCSTQDLNRPANRRITEGTKQHCVLITEQQESVRSQTKPEPCVCVCVFSPQSLSRSTAVDLVNSSNVLQQETKMLLEGKMLVSGITVPFSGLLLYRSNAVWNMIKTFSACVCSIWSLLRKRSFFPQWTASALSYTSWRTFTGSVPACTALKRFVLHSIHVSRA